MYKCNACGEPFTVTVGTVMETSHVPLHKWALAFRLMAGSKKGVSAHQLMRELGLGSYRTAWFLAHRVREAMADRDPEPLGGKGKTVEIDETFIGKPDEVFVSGKGWQGKRGTATKRKVLTMVERGGRAVSVKVEDLTIETLKDRDRQAPSFWTATLNTDEAQHYKQSARNLPRMTRSITAKRNTFARGREADHDEHGRGLLWHLQARHGRRLSALRRTSFAGVPERVRFSLFEPLGARR